MLSSRHPRPFGGSARVAISTGTRILWLGDVGPAGFEWGEAPRDLGTLHTLAARLGIRQLWLTPDALAFLGLPAELDRHPGPHRFLEAGGLTTPRGQDVLGPWLAAREPGGHFLEVSVPAWDRSSPFHGLDFGPALLGELVEFQQATGMLWRRTGAITSDAWLRERLEGLRVTEYPELAAGALLEPDLFTHRAPLPAEARARFLHAFDANAMYLGAASSLALPVGELTHWALPLEHPPWPQVRGPGYWLCGGDWLTTPSADYAGWIRAEESYSWSESHRFLEGWYRVLRDARLHLLPGGPSPALEAVKAVYRQGIGRLGSTRRGIPNDPLYHPYWRHAVQAEARTRLLRRVGSLKGRTPVAIDVDCLYFLTSQPDPLRFASRVGVPVGEAIGQFKVKGTMPGKSARVTLLEPNTRTVLAALREGAS